jgi:hypothetical protein
MTTSPTGAGAVVSVTVRYRTSDGKEGTLEINPNEYDSVFWTLEAVDRFLLPYYLAHYGFAEADRIRAELVREMRVVGIPIPRHKKLCSIVMGLDSDQPVFEPSKSR